MMTWVHGESKKYVKKLNGMFLKYDQEPLALLLPSKLFILTLFLRILWNDSQEIRIELMIVLPQDSSNVKNVHY